MNAHQPTQFPLYLMLVVALALAGIFFRLEQATTAQANTGDYTLAHNTYPGMVGTRIDSCSFCHSSVPSLNPYGQAYKNGGRNLASSLTNIESLDSDGDGFTNIQEIKALTFPGDATDHPTALPSPTATNTATKVPATATATASATQVGPTATKPSATATNTQAPTKTQAATATKAATQKSTATKSVSPSKTSVSRTPGAATPTLRATGSPTITPTCESEDDDHSSRGASGSHSRSSNRPGCNPDDDGEDDGEVSGVSPAALARILQIFSANPRGQHGAKLP